MNLFNVFLLTISLIFFLYRLVTYLKKTKFNFKTFLALVWFFFYFLFTYLALDYFYVFLFKNRTTTLELENLKLLSQNHDYFEIGYNQKNEKGGFFFNLKDKNYWYHNLDQKKNYSLEKSPDYFSQSTPFLDLPLKVLDKELRPTFILDAGKVINKVKLKTPLYEKVLPLIKTNAVHSYTLSPQGVIYSSLTPNNPFFELIEESNNQRHSLASPKKGHNYYPYFWTANSKLYYMNISRQRIKNTFLYHLMSYDFMTKKNLSPILLGGDQKINLRTVKVSGNNSGEFLAYNSLGYDNKINFLYYPPSKKKYTPLQEKRKSLEPNYFSLAIKPLSKIYSFSFSPNTKSPYQLLLLAQSQRNSHSQKKSIFELNLKKTFSMPLPIDGVFIVELLFLLMGGLAGLLSLRNLRIKQ